MASQVDSWFGAFEMPHFSSLLVATLPIITYWVIFSPSCFSARVCVHIAIIAVVKSITRGVAVTALRAFLNHGCVAQTLPCKAYNNI